MWPPSLYMSLSGITKGANDPLAKLVTKLVANLRTLKKASKLLAKLKSAKKVNDSLTN